MIPPPVQADFVGFARKLRRIFLPTIVFVGVTLATDSAYSQFVLTPTPGLPGVSAGSVAWGDFDNDGRLDFLITGLTNGATEVSQIWRNTDGWFTNVPVPELPGNFDNSLAWADFDNGRLDFLIAGTISGGNRFSVMAEQSALIEFPAGRANGPFGHGLWHDGGSEMESASR